MHPDNSNPFKIFEFNTKGPLRPVEYQYSTVKKSLQKSRETATTATKVNRSFACGTTQTPEWRAGPDGPRTLCNRCGLRHARKKPPEIMKIQSVISDEPVKLKPAPLSPAAADFQSTLQKMAVDLILNDNPK